MAQSNDELLDYEEQKDCTDQVADGIIGTTSTAGNDVIGSSVSVHSSGFQDFLLKPELQRAVVECGFEHPSQVQRECIPEAILGTDVVCQAKSGMGKTAVFVLATLQQLEPVDEKVSVLVLCHARELAFQIGREYERLSRYMGDVRVAVLFGGTPVRKDEQCLRDNCPKVVVGTPGRVRALIRSKHLNVRAVKHFVIDECDRTLHDLDMRADVREIFRATPRRKQVMMFSATISKDFRQICMIFTHNPMEVYVDDERKLAVHGVQQYFIRLQNNEKKQKLIELLNALEDVYNQATRSSDVVADGGVHIIIFVGSNYRCKVLSEFLVEHNFPAVAIERGMTQDERLKHYQQFKDCQKRILVTTNLCARGIDIERVNVVINYDMPYDSHTYLHCVARAGRFGTKGFAITFASSDLDDARILNEVQARFIMDITELWMDTDLRLYYNVVIDANNEQVSQ